MRVIKRFLDWWKNCQNDDPFSDPGVLQACPAGRPDPEPLSFYEKKEAAFRRIEQSLPSWLHASARCRWYKKHLPKLYWRRQLLFYIRLLSRPALPLWLDFLRWMLIDGIRGRNRRFWGIYQFVALPGEGKTMSMVAHMERARKRDPGILIATNFGYVHQDCYIEHWVDIIKAAMCAKDRGVNCIIAIDEIHVLFDSADWRSFPAELLALLSFNRKFGLQFLCSSQIYERIPKKVRDIANYTVICKNVWSSDRLFRDYYFTKADYESSFDGKRVSAQFIREFVASDAFYGLYDTLEQIDRMTEDAMKDKAKKQEAFELLFGDPEKDGGVAVLAPPSTPRR